MLRLSLRTAMVVSLLSALLGGSVPAQAAATGGPATLWASEYDRAHANDFAVAVTTSPDGSLVFVTGTTETTSGATGKNYTTVAYDATTGALRWAKPYDFTSHRDDAPVAIAASPDGASVFVTGSSTGPNDQTDYATVAYDAATGAREWVRRYHGPGNENDSARAIAVSPDSAQVYVTGYSQDANLTYDYATVAYDAAGGARVWVRRFGSKKWGDFASAVAVSHDGSLVFVTGSASIHRAHGAGAATVAYDAQTGDLRWVARYEGRGRFFGASAIAASPDDSMVVITGSTVFHGSATIAYDASTGSQLWATRSLTQKSGGRMVGLAISGDGSRVFVENDIFATMALDAATGSRLWRKIYPPPGGQGQLSKAIAVSPDGSQTFVEGYSLDGAEYTTIAYDSSTGVTDWVRHYDGPFGGAAEGAALAVAPDGSALFVTGFIRGGDHALDYGTVAYGLG